MSGDLLLVVMASRDAPSLDEALRAAAAWAGVGRRVRVVGIAGAAGERPESSEAERWLDALAALGIHVEEVDARRLRRALREARSVMRCGSAARDPSLLVVDDALLEDEAVDDDDLAGRLQRAGQVVRA